MINTLLMIGCYDKIALTANVRVFLMFFFREIYYKNSDKTKMQLKVAQFNINIYGRNQLFLV